MLGRLLTTALMALTMACGSQGENSHGDAATRDYAKNERGAFEDVCAVARHPERLDGQRVRLRAIVVQDIEFSKLTSPACMGRRWDGYVGIDQSREWNSSGIATAILEASRRSTTSRTLAAEGEFEGIIHARLRPRPLNDVGPMPEFVAMIEVTNVDHVRLVAVAAVQLPEVPTTNSGGTIPH